MPEKVKLNIKCPCCGTVFSVAVKPVPGIDNAIVTCPNKKCGEKNLFRDFKQVQPASNQTKQNMTDNEETCYPHQNSCYGRDEDETTVKTAPLRENLIVGKLQFMDSAETAQLHVGHNLIGRRPSTQATLQISTPGKNRLSREHLVIEVKKEHNVGYVHYASLHKQKVNATSINGSRLQYGDCIVLKHGDLIELPDVTLRFELIENDATVLG